jgi:transmembrane sensor
MRKTDNGLAFLFRQYLAGTLNPADRSAFLQLVANDQSEEEIKALIEEEIVRLQSDADTPGFTLTDEQADLIFDHITAGKESGTSRSWGRRISMWIGSAAAVLLLLAGLYYYRSGSAEPVQPVVQMPVTDVAPGTTGAVLTLSNGQKIQLDSLHNGNIGKEGNATITKQNGGIVYAPGWVQKGELVYNTLTTPRAYQYQLTLPDGSRVWLNAESSIVYPTAFAGNERVVTVTGETYFEVVENKQQPFFVQYGNKKVEVVGTHFNVNAYPEETDSRVTLLQGAVKIHTGNSTGVLKPGQQAIINKANETIRITNEVDTDEVMAWKNGHFDFRETDLKTLMRQLMRWYDVDVEYQQGVPERHFTADISRNKNLSAVLKILELNRIHFRIENRKIIVTP